MSLLIIIPAYNEESNLPQTLRNIRTLVPEADYIVINDCSTDCTKELLRKTNTPYLDLPVNLGIGGGVQTGYRYALEHNYDIAIQFDGDGQHDAAYIYVLLLGLVLTVPIYKLDLKVGGKKPFSINEVWLKRHWIGVVITLLIGMALCIAGGLAFVNTLGYGDIGKLLWEYISSFSQLVRLWIVTCCVHWRTWIKGAVAALGNYDVFPNDIITWIGVSSAFIFALIHHKKANTSTFTGKEAVDGHFSKWDIFVWYGLFCVLVVTVLMTMIEWGFFIYGIDSSLPYSATMRLLPRIEGVQGRYFYPILPLLFIPLHTKKDYLKFIPSYLYKICYYLLMTIYPISVLLERYWGI